MPMRGRVYGPQNRILKSERDGGHNVSALRLKFESLAQNQSPQKEISQRIRRSKSNCGQEIGSRIQFFESMPMSGRVYGPQNRILKSERDGGHNVSALRLKFESLAQNQSPQKERHQRIQRSESNCGQEVESRIQFFESILVNKNLYLILCLK